MTEELSIKKTYKFIPVFFDNQEFPENYSSHPFDHKGAGIQITTGFEVKRKGVPCIDIFCNEKFLFSWKPEGVFDIDKEYGKEVSILLKQEYRDVCIKAAKVYIQALKETEIEEVIK